MGLILLFGGEPAAPPVTPAPTTSSLTTPQAVFEMTFTDPGQPPNWENETAWLREFATNRGRDDELDRQKAGYADVRLDARDGRYAPENASGAHFPNVLPMRGARLSVLLESGYEAFTIGSSYVGGPDALGAGDLLIHLFTGFTSDYPETWDPSNADAEVQLDLTDGFEALEAAQFDHSGSTEFTGSRVSRVLDDIGWPVDMRAIDPGDVMLMSFEVSDKALQHLHKVAETEGGNIFIDGAGTFVFHDSNRVPDVDPADVYGGSPGEIPYQDLKSSFGRTRLWNQITVDTVGNLVAPATSSSPTSIARNGPRALAVTVLDAAGITALRAAELRTRYAIPRRRITSLVLRPTTAAQWQQVLTHEIGDYVLLRKRPAGADMIEQPSRIEAIRITAPNAADITVTWQLSAHIDPPVSLLTENQQSFETGTTGWVAESDCTISQNTDIALDGVASLMITLTLTADGKVITTPVNGIPVTAGSTYRAIAAFHEVTPGHGVLAAFRMELDWYTGASAFISTSTGTPTNGANGVWVWAEVEGTAPGTAAFGVVRLVVDLHAGSGFEYVVDLVDFYCLDCFGSGEVSAGAFGDGTFGSGTFGG